MRTEFSSIEDGFDKLPALTASTAIVVNGAGTALGNTVGTLALAGNFATTGAFAVTLAASADVVLTLPAVAGTLATLAGTETLSNKTMIAPNLGTPSVLVGTNITGTAAALTAGNVTTNANLTGPISSSGNATSITAQTGTGTTFVVQTSPTLITPALGVATATSINKVVITAPATSATLTIADGKTLTANASLTLAGTDGKTLTVSNSLALAGTDSTTMTFPSTNGTIATLNIAQAFSAAQTFQASATTFGVQSTTRGTLVLGNTAVGAKATTVQSSNTATAAWTLTLPPDAGTAASYLQSDGSGNATWAPGTAAYSVIESKTVSGTPSSVEFKNLTIEDGILYIAGLTITAGTATLRVEFSTDNGSTYFGTVYNLLTGVLNQTALWAQFPINGMRIGLVTLPIFNSATAFSASGPPSNPTAVAANSVGSFLSFGSSITAIRISTSASTFVNGSVITLVGRA